MRSRRYTTTVFSADCTSTTPPTSTLLFFIDFISHTFFLFLLLPSTNQTSIILTHTRLIRYKPNYFLLSSPRFLHVPCPPFSCHSQSSINLQEISYCPGAWPFSSQLSLAFSYILFLRTKLTSFYFSYFCKLILPSWWWWWCIILFWSLSSSFRKQHV